MADLAYTFHWTPQTVESLTWIEINWWANEAERIAKEQKTAIEKEQSKTKTRRSRR